MVVQDKLAAYQDSQWLCFPSALHKSRSRPFPLVKVGGVIIGSTTMRRSNISGLSMATRTLYGKCQSGNRERCGRHTGLCLRRNVRQQRPCVSGSANQYATRALEAVHPTFELASSEGENSRYHDTDPANQLRYISVLKLWRRIDSTYTRRRELCHSTRQSRHAAPTRTTISRRSNLGKFVVLQQRYEST